MLKLDGKLFTLTSEDLPCLISGKEGSGSSFFTIKLILELFYQGYKLLFFSAYPMAKDQFLKEVNNQTNIGKIFTTNDLKTYKDKQALLIMENDPQLFLKALQELPDISNRIIIVKNIDEVDSKTIEKTLAFDKCILSGDLDNCILKENILEKKWKTKILFSQLKETKLSVNLPQYKGYFMSDNKQGIIEVNA